jgi:hypothetical protein
MGCRFRIQKQMKQIIQKISNILGDSKRVLIFILKYLVVLPLKVILTLLILTGVVVSCSHAATPWEQIPFSKAPESGFEWYMNAGSAGEIVATTPEELTDLWFSSQSRHECSRGASSYPYEHQFNQFVTWKQNESDNVSCSNITLISTRRAVDKTCPDTNYPIAIDSNNDGEIDVCERGQCPTSNNTNSEFDFVISRPLGSPTEYDITASTQKCMPVGHGGTYCVVEAARFTDSSGYNNDYYTQENSGTHASTGQICGDLLPDSGGGGGTTAEGTEEADFCFFSGGSMNCYRDPEQVCPDGNCQVGCASLGGEAWCVQSGNPSDGTGNPSGPPNGFGSGGAGTGDTSGGDGGNGDGAPDSGTGDGSGGSGGGGGDSGTGEEEDDPPAECEPTENTVCGENDFYEANNWDEKNFGTVMEGFQNRVLSSEVGTATAGFFNITTSGTCEVWSVNTYNLNIVIDQHCSAIALTIFPIVRAILLAMATFVSFRWAFL